MTDTRSTSVSAPPQAGKGALTTGAVLLVVGILGLILGTVFTRNAVQSLTGEIGSPQKTPVTITQQLNALTTYAVYGATDSGSSAVQASDITVTSDGGFPLTVNKTSDTVKVNGPDGKPYTEVVTFDIGTSGTFTIKVATQGGTVTVAPAMSTASKGIAWIVAIGLGALLAVIGLILVIIGAVRRFAARK